MHETVWLRCLNPILTYRSCKDIESLENNKFLIFGNKLEILCKFFIDFKNEKYFKKSVFTSYSVEIKSFAKFIANDEKYMLRVWNFRLRGTIFNIFNQF